MRGTPLKKSWQEGAVRRPRKLRALLRIAGFLLLLVVIAFVVLCFVPLNWPFLNRQILGKLQASGDVRMAYESAQLLAGQGRYRVKNLTYFRSGPTSSSPLLTIGELDVIVRPLALLTGSEAFIKSIEIHKPSELDLVYDQHGVGLGKKSAFLRESMRGTKSAKSNSSAAQFPFDRMQIHDASIACVERQSSATAVAFTDEVLPGMRSGRIRMNRVNIDARSRSGGKIQATVAGVLSAGDHTSEFEGEMELPTRNKASLTLAFPSLEVSRLFVENPTMAASGDKVELAMNIERLRSGYSIGGQIRAERARFVSPEQEVDIHDEQFSLACDAAYTSNTGTFTFKNCEANSSLLAAKSSGEFAVTQPHKFEVQLHASRMGEAYQKLLGRLLPEGYAIASDESGVLVDATATGNNEGLASVVGKLTFTSVTVTSNYLASPLEQITGEVNFEPRRLVLHGGQATMGKTRISAEGIFEGDYLKDRRGDLKLKWKANASTADLFSAFKVNANGGKSASAPPSGTIRSEGSLDQFVSLRKLADSGTPKITGSVDITNAGFSHPSFPAPVQRLNGRLRIKDQIVEVDSLRGDMQGNEVKVQGRLAGQKVFWSDPVLTATISTRFDLREVFNYMPPHLRDKVVPYDIAGEATTNLQVYTKLVNWSNATFTGRVETKNVSFNPQLAFMVGNFSEVNSTLRWDGEAVYLEKLFARLNGEPLTASGVLSPTNISLNLQSKMNLKAMPETFPKMQKWLVMEGPARADVRFSVADNAAPPLAPSYEPGFGGKLIPMISLVAERLNQAVAARSYLLDGKIEFGDDTGGARLRHNAMPPARVNEQGKAIPQAELVNMRGTAILAGDTIRTDKSIRCSFADTPNCSFDGAIQFRDNNLPKMDFTVNIDGEARLDPWLLAWGKALERPDSPPPGDKKFDLNAIINADRVYYRNQRAGRMHAEIGFQLDQTAGRPRRTQFRNIQIQSADGAGQLRASGNLQTYPWGAAGEFPKWSCNTDVQQMQLLPMLSCIFRDVQTLDANVTGHIELAANGTGDNKVTGSGTANMQNVSIHQTTVMQRLGQTTGQSFRQLFRTADTTMFRISNGAISTPQIQLQTAEQGMTLTMSGSYFFANKTLDAKMELGLLNSTVGKIPLPLLRELSQTVDRLTGSLLLSFRVSGPATDPNIQPVLVPLLQGATNILAPQ